MVNCPIQVKAARLVLRSANKIRLVVHIAIAEELHNKLAGFTVLVHIPGQQGACKGQGAFASKPCREIFLVMICIAYHNTLASLVVGPGDRLLLTGVFIGYTVVIHHFAYTVYVCTSTKFIPLVIWNTVAVGILADHDNSRLRTACIRHAGSCKSITPNVQVVLARNVNYRMIKSKCHIASETSEAYHALIGKQFGTLSSHSLGIITILPLGHGVDKLSWGRHIFIHFVKIG